MKKSTLFISAVLTAFILAVMGGLFSVVRNFSNTSQGTAVQPAQVAQVAETTTAITPQDAAQIAARYMGRSDLYSVENATYNGMNAYKVTFSSGDVVYIGLQGELLSIVSAPSIIIFDYLWFQRSK